MTDFMAFFIGWLQSSGMQSLYHAVETNIIRAAAYRRIFIDRKTVTWGRNFLIAEGEKKKGKRKNKQKLVWLFKHCSYWRSVCKSELEASGRSCPQRSKQQRTAWSRTLGHWVTAQKADLDPPLSSRGNAEVIWNHRSNSYFLIYHIIC